MNRWPYDAGVGFMMGLLILAQSGALHAEAPANKPANGPSNPEIKSYGTQVAGEARLQIVVKLNYLLYLPKDYDQKSAWPLVLFLHGAGERGDSLDLVKLHGPPRLIAAGKQFPFIVVSPQCPEYRWWNPDELLALLDAICAKYKVDPDRIYVTGLSMGGFASWMLAIKAPDRFAAVVPICGRGEPRAASRIAHIPAWVFHGAKDDVVRLQASEEMVKALKEEGAEVKFTVYPQADHDSWTETYNNPKLYEWLLEQKRKPAGKPKP